MGDILLRHHVEIPPDTTLCHNFDRHERTMRKTTRFSTEIFLSFFVYAIPLLTITLFFYWCGASYNSLIVGITVSLSLAFYLTYVAADIAKKRTILEKCFYFNPYYTSFILSHPVCFSNVLDHLNYQMYVECRNAESADGTKTNQHGVRTLRRKASEVVLKRIFREIVDTKDVMLVKSKNK